MGPILHFLAHGGEMAALIKARDWNSSPLGPPEHWPELLKSTLQLVLRSNHPMLVWWGPGLIQFYNDAYRQTMDHERNPGALGQAGRDYWQEIWPARRPQID